MKLSVVMPVYNEQATLQEVIERVLAVAIDIELICVDDGSNDRSREILAELPDRYARILRLRFLDSCTLREAAHAMNISLGNAKVLQHRALRHAARVTGESQ